MIERVGSEDRAEQIVRYQSTDFLKGVWQYFDKDDGKWYSCVIKEANQARVVVSRTNVMGYQEPANYKHAVLESPDETKLVKAQ